MPVAQVFYHDILLVPLELKIPVELSVLRNIGAGSGAYSGKPELYKHWTIV